MSLYLEGYKEALAAVRRMDELELLAYIDGLEGRGNLPKNHTLAQLQLEAQDQCSRKFKDKSSRYYEMIEYWRDPENSRRDYYPVD